MTLQELVVKITADTKEFNKKMEGVKKGLNNASKDMAIAGGAIAGALTLAVKNAAGEEEAQAKLAAAMKATKQYTEKARKELTNYAGQLQNTTGIGDEAIQSAMAFGMQMGLTKEQVKALTPHLLDMSAATGVDLQTAMRAAAMATKGQVGMLQRYGVQVKKNEDGTVDFNNVLNSFSGYTGAAEAKGKTLNGQIEIMKAMFADLTKEIGFALIPVLKDFINKYIKPLIEKFQALPKPVKENIAKFGALTAATLLVGSAVAKLISGVMGIIPAIKGVMGIVSTMVSTNPMLLMIAGITAAVALLVVAWKKDWGGIREKTEAVWKKIKPIFTGIKKAIDNIIDVVKLYVEDWKWMWSQVQPLFHKLGNAFEWIKKVVVGVFEKIKGWFDKFIGWILNAIDKIKKLIDKLNIFKKFKEKAGEIEPSKSAVDLANEVGAPIPGHAAGGYFTRPHLAWIAEKGPEYVIPARVLEKNTKSVGNITVNVTYNISGDAEQIKKQLRQHDRELLRMLRGGKYALV